MEVRKLIALLNELMQGLAKNGEYPQKLHLEIALLKKSLGKLNEHTSIGAKHIARLQLIIKQFWHWFTDNTQVKYWRKNKQTEPWKKLQSDLAYKILDPKYHHALLFNKISERFEQQNNKLPLEFLLLLLSKTCTTLEFAPQKRRWFVSADDREFARVNRENYPADRLSYLEEIKEYYKLSLIITNMAILFYLLFYYCNNEQTQLLRLAIQFRPTNNLGDQRSEKLLLHFLLTNTCGRLSFFNQHKEYIDYTILEDTFFSPLRNLLPSRKMLLFQLDSKRWPFAFLGIRLQGLRGVVIPTMVCELESDFASYPITSYHDALRFAKSVELYRGLLEIHNNEYIHDAIKVFCLQQYVAKRDSEEDSLPFSRETKCQVAEKEIDRLSGRRYIPLSFWEKCASYQGRLGEIMAMPSSNLQEKPDRPRF